MQSESSESLQISNKKQESETFLTHMYIEWQIYNGAQTPYRNHSYIMYIVALGSAN